jgi:predicted CXXCH cytochrome family protein
MQDRSALFAAHGTEVRMEFRDRMQPRARARTWAWLAAIPLVVGLFGWTASGMANIANTKHNLSVGGPGTHKATAETQICVFCHTPHNTNPAVPLWNHALSAAVYTPYGSNTLAAAAPGQPTGTSKLCLSCHDGTVALGGVQNLPFGHQASGTISGLEAFLTGPASLGTDLRNDHPISFTYDATLAATNPELVSPAALTGKIKPDSTGQMQCSSCHDPHVEANPKFLHVGYTDGAGYGSPLCRTCHDKQYWSTVSNMSHREQTRQWNGAGDNPWHVPGHNLPNDPNSTNKANGCESCHQPHNAATSGSRILKQDGEAKVCLVCHNGNVSYWNIDAALNKMYAHPTKNPAYDGRHNPKRMPDGKVREEPANLGSNRHAECEDCHNPHAVSPGVSPAPNPAVPNSTNNLAAPVNKGVWGVQPTWPAAWQAVTTYTVVDDVQYQHQLCLKCHSYYAFGATPPADPYGIIAGGINTDQAKEFNPNNASYHPVVAPGKNPFNDGVNNYASSLINGMTPTSIFTCSECHSDSNPFLPGLKGPHGADVWPILWGPYDRTTGMINTQNHLCFKCHDWMIYAGTTDYNGTALKTGFRATTGQGLRNMHARHVNLRDMPCLACHTAVPHGMPNRALLVYGRGAKKDPEPYNAHNQMAVCENATYLANNMCNDYGINSNITNVNAIASGTWKRTDCHNGSGTGSCSSKSTYP